MNLIKYRDAEIIDLSVDMDVVRKQDGWYIIGGGCLIKVSSQEEGRTLQKKLVSWLKKNPVSNHKVE